LENESRRLGKREQVVGKAGGDGWGIRLRLDDAMGAGGRNPAWMGEPVDVCSEAGVGGRKAELANEKRELGW